MNIHGWTHSCQRHYDSQAKLCHWIYQNGLRRTIQFKPQNKPRPKKNKKKLANTEQNKRVHVKLKVNKVAAQRQVARVWKGPPPLANLLLIELIWRGLSNFTAAARGGER